MQVYTYEVGVRFCAHRQVTVTVRNCKSVKKAIKEAKTYIGTHDLGARITFVKEVDAYLAPNNGDKK